MVVVGERRMDGCWGRGQQYRYRRELKGGQSSYYHLVPGCLSIPVRHIHRNI